MISFGKYSKTIVAVVGAFILWAKLVVDSPSADVTSGEWIALLIGIATAIGVYGVTNKTTS
jgi:hypothetical protein